ncbi:hypothetical protein FIBSPDRAFT_905509 [Athelia psychrophila]|uniref:Uncharacterized protein n=1 Tax=Athelia psychrophila TaxID=1759441 RepID=A0A167TDG4_9AGAM|nr:hypothetical protein FIBSPDRAFT_905509 [Fibularhizoctonia sp. CBS 109695]
MSYWESYQPYGVPSLLGDGYAPCEYSTISGDARPTAAVFDADLPTSIASAFRPENDYPPSAQHQLAHLRRAAWDAAAARAPSPPSPCATLLSLPANSPRHNNSARDSTEPGESSAGGSDMDESEDEGSEEEVEQAAQGRRRRADFPSKDLQAMAEQAAIANPWMAKHGAKGKAWKSLFEGLRSKGKCEKHPDLSIRKKVEELIGYKQASCPNIRQVLGRSGEIMIAAPLDRCLGFIAMAKEMTEKKAAAARKRIEDDEVGGRRIRQAAVSTMRRSRDHPDSDDENEDPNPRPQKRSRRDLRGQLDAKMGRIEGLLE